MTFLNLKKMGKWNNKPVVYNGIKFDSRGELARYLFLQEKQKEGVISELTLKPHFELIPPLYEEVEKQLKTKTKIVKKLVCNGVTFTPDFAYTYNDNYIVEDFKGSKATITEPYKLRKKMLYFFHKIKVTEVFSPTAEII